MKKVLLILSLVSFIAVLSVTTWEANSARACGTSDVSFNNSAECCTNAINGIYGIAVHATYDHPSTPSFMVSSTTWTSSGISNANISPYIYYPSSCSGTKAFSYTGDDDGTTGSETHTGYVAISGGDLTYWSVVVND